MKIAICGSMVFADKMIEFKRQLEDLGHEVLISQFAKKYIGKTEKVKEELAKYHKNERDAIREFWKTIKKSDAILVLNYDRRCLK
jgi:predicted RNA-binding protein with PUA domain